MAMAPRNGFLAAGLIIGLFAATYLITWAFYCSEWPVERSKQGLFPLSIA
jgi:hypothetical protein